VGDVGSEGAVGTRTLREPFEVAPIRAGAAILLGAAVERVADVGARVVVDVPVGLDVVRVPGLLVVDLQRVVLEGLLLTFCLGKIESSALPSGLMSDGGRMLPGIGVGVPVSAVPGK